MSRKTKKLMIAIGTVALLFSGAVFIFANSGSSGPSAAPNLAEYGLVGYWNMEEGKGQTVYDRSGNGNNGTLGASTGVAKDDPVFTSGYSSAGPGGTALKFDGKDDYVDAGNGASLNITQNITVEAWVKLNNSAVSNRIASKHGSGYGWTFGNNGNKMLFGFSTTGADWNEWLGNTSLSSSVWYHFAAVRDYTNSKVYFYLNGVSDRTPVDFSGQINIAGVNTRIGRDGYCGGTGCFFNGSIDEVRIYNRALSADEIRQHYNQKKPILDMKFDEGSGTSTKDESFNNNDGVLYSGATSCSNPPTAGCPTWVQGKYGSALSFDGTDDYVSVPTISIADNIPWSVSMWVKPDVVDSNFRGLYGNAYTTNDYSRLYFNNATIRVDNEVNTEIAWSNTLLAGNWQHIALVADGATNAYVTLYINGESKGTGNNYFPDSSLVVKQIGGVGSTSTALFDGLIDSVRVYNYARTQDEILVDYNSGKAAHLGKDSQRDDGLVGYWNMEEGKGQTVYDRSGNGNNGTLGASTAVAKDDPVFTRRLFLSRSRRHSAEI